MNLVRIPIQELDKVWSMIEKDIKSALAYSSQLTDSDFVFDLSLIHISEPTRQEAISYAVFCLKKKN